MKTRPLYLNLLSLLFLTLIFSFPAQIMDLYGHEVSEYEAIFSKISQMNWILVWAFATNFYLCLKASPYLKLTIPITIMLVAYNNWLVSSLGSDFSETATLAATLAFSFLCYGIFFTKGIQAINHPELRWWTIPKRHLKNIPVWIESKNGTKILARVFDISKTGLFISCLEGNHWFTKHFNPGDNITLKIAGDSGVELNVSAEVVRKAIAPKGIYPEGMGVQFKEMGIKETFNLNRLLLQKDYAVA